jgi:copper transport protein
MRRWGRIAGFVVLACAFAASCAPAAAHAVLEASDPAAGARVERSPAQVVLTFDEPVETSLGAVRIIDASGALIAGTGSIVHPNGDGRIVGVTVPSLARGRYVVVWHVISADSHPVAGAYAFGIGVAAGDPPALERDPAGAIITPIVHGVLLAAALLAIGLPIGAAALDAAGDPAGFVEFAAWFVVIVAAFADVALRAEINGGTLGASFATHTGALRTLTMVAALSGIVAVSGRRRNRAVLGVAGVALVLSLSLAGHAADGAFPVLGVAADALHLSAAAAWIGVLAIGVTRGPSAVLRRISPLATWAVATIVLTGTLQAVRNVGAWRPLLDADYGHAIDLKIALLVGVLAIALNARRALARGAFALRRQLGVELALLAAIVGVTAVLVDLPLPREAIAASASAPAAVVATTAFRVRDIDVHVAVTVAGRFGLVLHVAGTGPAGAARALDGVDVSVTETRRGAGPFAVPMTRTAAGTYDGALTLPFAGAWTAFVSARSGDFDENHTTIPLDLPAEERR